MSWEEVVAIAILNVTLCIITGLGIWAAIRTEDKPKNRGTRPNAKPE